MGRKVEGFHGFYEARTGLPVGLLVETGGDGGTVVTLAPQDRANRMHYRGADIDALRDVLAEDREGWRTSESLPGWGPYRPDDLVPARFEISVRFDAVDLKGAAPIVSVARERKVPAAVVRQWSPELREALPRESAFALVAARADGAGAELVDRIGGKVILDGSSLLRKVVLVAALPVEERHREMGDVGLADAILVCLSHDGTVPLDAPSLKAACRERWDSVPADTPSP